MNKLVLLFLLFGIYLDEGLSGFVLNLEGSWGDTCTFVQCTFCTVHVLF